MKVFMGRNERTASGGFHVMVVDQGGPRPLPPRHDLCNHSPDGFAWGYGGSGPAQLALALAADVLEDDRRALAAYQGLKWKLVARLPDGDWELSAAAVQEAILQVEEGV